MNLIESDINDQSNEDDLSLEMPLEMTSDADILRAASMNKK